MQNTENTDIERNFFYSANSEHYQDAVLTYIFYNYPKKKKGKYDKKLSEIEKFSKYFTGKLIDGAKNISITKIETQVHDSDIDLIIHTNDGDHLVIIEDKTGTSIHSSGKKQKNSNDENPQKYFDTQLEKYYYKFIHDKDYQKYFKEGRIHLYYYKNEYVNFHEEAIIKKAGDGCKGIFCNSFQDGIANTDKEYQKLLNSITEWKILDIQWICKTFNEFFKDTRPDNLILRDYLESIKFWQIEKILSKEYEINSNDPNGILLWGDTSKLWNPVFCQVLEDALGKDKDYLDQYTKVKTYNGKYWQMSLRSKDKKTCMIISSKGITKDRIIKIDINLRNPKYDVDEPIPDDWKVKDARDNDCLDKDARHKDWKKLHDIIENVEIDGAKLKLSKGSKKDGQDNNKICHYEFDLSGKKVNHKTFLDCWMKVQNIFSLLDKGAE